MPASAGARFGPYEIVALIGRGGMGEVYHARDLRLGRDVAIKILPDAFSADGDRLRRFEQEARAAALLNHANIVSIYDVGTHDSKPYVVSELLEGQTLRTILAGGAFPVDVAIRYALQLCRGLAAAHARGIVHRDLKPENLFITTEGRLKILDFGLAKLVKRNLPSVAASQTTLPGTSTPVAIIGTIGYASPEQLLGESTDHRSDIFSFGAILYEMITGRRAFRAENPIETMYATLKNNPPSFSRAGDEVRNALDLIVGRCLEKAAKDRFQTVGEIFKVRGGQLALALSAESGMAGEVTTTANRIGIEEENVGERHWTLSLGTWLGIGFILLALILTNDLEDVWPISILLWALGAWTGWRLLHDATHFALAAVLTPVGLVAEWQFVTRFARPGERLGISATGVFLLALAYFMAPDDNTFAWRGRLLRWIGGLALVPAMFVLVIAAPPRLGTPPNFAPITLGWLVLGWTLAIGAPTAVAVVLRKRAAWMNAVAAAWCVVAVAIPVNGPATALLVMIWFAIGALALSASGAWEARSERINVGSLVLAISLLSIAGIAARIVGWAAVPLLGACLWLLERTRRRLVRAAVG